MVRLLKERYLVLILLILPISVFGLQDDADDIWVWCEYPSGNNAYGTDDICGSHQTATEGPVTCNAPRSSNCNEEGDVDCFVRTRCQCPDGGDAGGSLCDASGYFTGSTVAYTVNYDSSSTDCNCLGGVGNCDNGETDCWEPDASDCCGDDGSSDDWCDGSGGYQACDNGVYRSDADSNQRACECGFGGTQGNCDNGEQGCWEPDAWDCCGDDGGSDDWCDGSGGYQACDNGVYRSDPDSNSRACECGFGGSQNNCDWNGEQGCWEPDASECCGDDGSSDDWCDGSNNYEACRNGVYRTDADSFIEVCACGPGGDQGTCDNGESGCWESDASECCGDDGGSDDWCDGSGGYQACDNGVYRTDPDSNSRACECGFGGSQTNCDWNGEQGCWEPDASECCGDDGGSDDWCDGSNNYEACRNGVYRTDADSYMEVCACGPGGDQGFCDNGEAGCWEPDASDCCGDDGGADDWCDGANGFRACVDGTYRTDPDAYQAACACGPGGDQGTCDNGETDCWEPDASDCCGDDGVADDWCDGANNYNACVDGTYRTDADSDQVICACGPNGDQNTCDDGESGCWEPDASDCCGDDGGETWCDGANDYNACVGGTYQTDADSDQNICACGPNGDQGTCDDGEEGCWVASTGDCCGDDGLADNYCTNAGTDYSSCELGVYQMDVADTNSNVCGCEGGAWGLDECDTNNEVACWDTDSSRCCGNSGALDEWCDGVNAGCDNAVYYTDPDNSQYICENCGGGYTWTGNGGSLNCGGDDAGEWVYCESFYPYRDAVDSCATCADVDSCVDDNTCFGDGARRDIGEIDDGVNNNDIEWCDGVSHTWIESDNDETTCANAVNWSNSSLTCSGSDCWINEVEQVIFGGYEQAVSAPIQQECCGDDVGEYYIITNRRSGCASDPNDFIFSDELLSNSTLPGHNHSWIYGYVYGEIVDGSYEPLEGAWISTRWPDFRTINEDITDSTGWFNISVPEEPAVDVYATRSTHLSQDIRVNTFNSVYVNFTMNLTNECVSDCTKFDGSEYRCVAACDGINNCSFDPGVTSDKFGGKSMKVLCDGLLKGWTVDHNDTYNIGCCNAGYVHTVNKTLASVRFNMSVTDAQTYYAGTVNYIPSGELYSVYVVVYEKE